MSDESKPLQVGKVEFNDPRARRRAEPLSDERRAEIRRQSPRIYREVSPRIFAATDDTSNCPAERMFNDCAAGHDRVYYTGADCPACRLRAELSASEAREKGLRDALQRAEGAVCYLTITDVELCNICRKTADKGQRIPHKDSCPFALLSA